MLSFKDLDEGDDDFLLSLGSRKVEDGHSGTEVLDFPDLFLLVLHQLFEVLLMRRQSS